VLWRNEIDGAARHSAPEQPRTFEVRPR
jgi:hypothetical protein